VVSVSALGAGLLIEGYAASVDASVSSMAKSVRMPSRTRALTLIIGYKLIKAALMLGLAIFLTAAPARAYRDVQRFGVELAVAGATLHPVGKWIDEHLTTLIVTRGTLLVWLDAISSGAEDARPLTGSSWGEWIVAGGLGVLLPVEILSLRRGPSIAEIRVLVVNAAVVAYLLKDLRARPPCEWPAPGKRLHQACLRLPDNSSGVGRR